MADPVEREAYRRSWRAGCKVDERALCPGGAQPAGSRRRKPSTLSGRPSCEGPEASRARIERFCLGLLLRSPEIAYRVDRQLAEGWTSTAGAAGLYRNRASGYLSGHPWGPGPG